MRFEHRITIPASGARTRALLDDFERAAKCLPGVEEVRETGAGQYEGRMRVKVGPLRFDIAGTASVETREGLAGWIARGEGKDGKLGAGVKASLEASVAELSVDSTEVQIVADVRFSGPLAGLGQPLIKRKADEMVQQFSENLARAVTAPGLTP